MKAYAENAKSRWEKTTPQFRGFIFVILAVIGLTIGFLCNNKKELPPPTVVKQPLKEKMLTEDIARLKRELAEEQQKLAACMEVNERLKDSLYVLEQKAPVVVTPPAPSTRETKTVFRRRATAVCNCPTAFGYYRNRGSASSTRAMTKKYCKIHGTRK